ncbi:MAG: hypothetical protein ACI9HK_004649, partial [Pirellulaceae bacterium]
AALTVQLNPLRNRVTVDRKPTGLASLGALVREPQEVESIRSVFTVSLATLDRVLFKFA